MTSSGLPVNRDWLCRGGEHGREDSNADQMSLRGDSGGSAMPDGTLFLFSFLVNSFRQTNQNRDSATPPGYGFSWQPHRPGPDVHFFDSMCNLSENPVSKGQNLIINFMEDFTIALTWLGFFASIFFGWYYFIQARNKERLALIEKNADVSEIFRVRRSTFRFPWLKLGMIVVGVGLGLCITLVVQLNSKIMEGPGDMVGILAVGLMMFFGGLGAVVAHFIDKQRD